MPAALLHSDYGHPAVGALIYMVIVAVAVGYAVFAARRGRNRRRPPR